MIKVIKQNDKIFAKITLKFAKNLKIDINFKEFY